MDHVKRLTGTLGTRQVFELGWLAASIVVVTASCDQSTDLAKPQVWILEPDLEIGHGEEGPSSFSDIRSFGVDTAGRLYVLEAKEQEIRVFDSAGRAIRRLGRRGSGPREFRQANGIAVHDDGHLWVYDPGLHRVTVFDSRGADVQTISLQIPAYGFLWGGGVDSLGRLYDQQFIRKDDTTYIPYLRRIDPLTRHVDTLRWPSCGATRPAAFRFPLGTTRVPYASGEYLDFDARGFLWCADTRRVFIVQQRVGDTIPERILTAPLEPAPVNDAERDSAIKRVTAFMERAGRADLDFSLIPATKPIVQSIDMDDRHRIWVRTLTRQGVVALVFDTTGSLLAEVPLPREPVQWSPLVVRRSLLYALFYDSLDVPHIGRFRLVQSP